MAEFLQLSIMTWNVENLFLPNDSGGSGPRNEAVYKQKLANCANTIRNIAPDVIGFQEIGSPDAFAALMRLLGDRYPYTRLSRNPDRRGIRNAYASKMPLLQARDYDTFPKNALANLNDEEGKPIDDMGRGALGATVVIAPGLLVNVMNVHLKSKLLTFPGGRRYPRDEDERARGTAYALIKRTAEAVAVRVELNRLMTGNDEPMILMGDMNDDASAITTQIMLGPEDRSLYHRDKFDDVRLYALDEYIPAERRYSRVYHKKGEMIDHICVSKELIFFVRRVDSFVEPIDSIDQSVESRRDAVYPDHAPVFVRFEIPEDEAERNFAITRPVQPA